MTTRSVRRTRLVGALGALTLTAVLAPGLTSAATAQPDAEAAPARPDISTLDLSTLGPAELPEPGDATLADSLLEEAYQSWEEDVSGEGAGGSSQDDALQVEILLPLGSTAADQVIADVEALGGTGVEKVTSELLLADVPFDTLEDVQALAGVEYVRLPLELNAPPPPLPASDGAPATGEGEVGSQTGSYGSDILNKTKANAWHAAGVTGSGVKVGIIDYFHSSYWNGAVGAGEIASGQPKGTFCRSNGKSCNIWSSNTQHGTAVAEVISDLAPGAELYIATVNTTADTKAAIKYFHSKGVRVVSRSLGAFLDGPGNGKGAAADLLKYAVSKDMAWFNSAGNHGVQQSFFGEYVGGYWRGKWRDTDNDGWLEFRDPRGIVGPGEVIPVDCGFMQGLRWDDWKRNRTDYDLVAFDEDLKKVIKRSSNKQRKGAPPIEGASFNNINCATYPWYYVAIARKAKGNGTGNDTLELMANSSMYYYVTNAHSATQPFVDTKSPGGAGVGAVDPVGGTGIADYSSRGPTNDGRVKPNLSAGSNMGSYSYASYGGFNGTSAATPVVAGAAALVLQQDPKAKPADVVGFLTGYGTVDRGPKGSDNAFGTGELVLGAFSSKPKIKGTAKKGSTLTACPGVWGPTASVSLSYQWHRNGSPISGATAETYTVTKADRGKKLTVRVTGSQPGFATVTRASSATKIK